jgi:hypothetical protein
MPKFVNPFLTDRERAEVEKIRHETDDVDAFTKLPDEVRAAILHRIGRLMTVLLKRKAIPDVRFAYLTERKRNPGGRGKSLVEVFESNGTSGPAIFKHGNFPPHFRYLINGPNLPQSVIDEFTEIAERQGVGEVTAYVTKAVRQHDLEPEHTADEFFHLAHEIGHGLFADAARAAARNTKR